MYFFPFKKMEMMQSNIFPFTKGNLRGRIIALILRSLPLKSLNAFHSSHLFTYFNFKCFAMSYFNL